MLPLLENGLKMFIIAKNDLILNLYHILGKFSRWQIHDIFLFFLENMLLAFHENMHKRPKPIFWEK